MKKVFIVHGWTYSLDKWTEICRILRLKNIEPVQLRVPGLTEPSNKSWNVDDYVEWLDGKLKNEIKPVVIGHSNGGRIGLAYVQKYPGKLGQLVLIDSAGIPNNETKSLTKLKILRGVSKAGRVFGKVPLIKKGFYKFIHANDYLEAPPNMKITMQNMIMADQDLDPSAAKLPVTIIWGRNDGITPLSDGLKLHKAIKGSKLYIIEGARHSPIATHPGEVADIIAEIL